MSQAVNLSKLLMPLLRNTSRVCRIHQLRLSQRTKFYSLGASNSILNFNPSTYVCFRSYASKKAKKEKGKDKGKKGVKVEILKDEEIDGIIDKQKFEEELKSHINKLKERYIHELSVRTTPGLFDNMIIDTSDGKFPLNNIAQVILKNPQLILVNLSSSPQYVKAVKDALTKSGMNVNPQVEGTTIYLPLPKVTKEHRENLAKNAKSLAEKCKTDIRYVQTKYQKKVKAGKEHHSEDLVYRIDDMVTGMVKLYVQEVDELRENKQKELLGED